MMPPLEIQSLLQVRHLSGQKTLELMRMTRQKEDVRERDPSPRNKNNTNTIEEKVKWKSGLCLVKQRQNGEKPV